MPQKGFSTFQEFLGFHEIGRDFMKASLAEFLGTFILIVSGCSSVVTLEPEKSTLPINTAATFAMTVAMIVWTLGHVSGAHINPTVSLCFLVTGHLSLAKFVSYVIFQCAGAIAGSAVVWNMVPPTWRHTIGSTVFAEGLLLWQGFMVEILATFFLILAVFATGDRLRTDHGGSDPLTIGLVVFMQSAWAGALTGCSMNPARTLGPALVSGAWDHHWVYWTAPNIGGICAALLYQHVLAEKPRDAADKLNTDADLNNIEKIITKEKESNYVANDKIVNTTKF